MGATIAFIGDRIGTRIGKRRLSFLGLRPRNTAVFMTVFTGMLITSATLGVASLLVPNVRLALTEDIEKIKEENEAMQKDYDDLSRARQELKIRLESLTQETAELDSRRELMEAEQKKAGIEVEKLRQESIRIHAELSQAQVEEQDLRSRLLAREAVVEDLKKELEAFRLVIEEKNSQVLESRSQLASLEEELEKSRLELGELNTRLAGMREEALKAIETISTLNEIIENKETRRLVLRHLEPIIEDPASIATLPSREEFSQAFARMLAEIRLNLEKLEVTPSFLRSSDMQGFEGRIYEKVEEIFRRLEKLSPETRKIARGVLLYPVSEHNIFAGEALDEVRFIVLEDRLLIPRGTEIYRMVLRTDVPAEDLLRSVFEKDEEIKKLMFGQGVLGNPYKSRSPRQIIQFARFVDALKTEQPKAYISILADDDIYASGNFAFRYNLVSPQEAGAFKADETSQR